VAAQGRGLDRARGRRAIVPALPGDPCKHPVVTHDRVPPDADDPDTTDDVQRAREAGEGAAAQSDDPGERAAAESDGLAEADLESAYELLQRGQSLMRARHNAQAAVVLERAARIEPGKASILEALGRAYFNSGQHERSRETFDALLEIDPSSHYAQFALGQSLKKLGREKEAWVHLRLAVALSPGTSLYRQALARVPDPKATDDDPEP
jgi:tetratricopeptide (TPR) repeat protein